MTTRTSIGACIAAMGLLALFAFATLPQAPLELPRAAESTIVSGGTAAIAHAESASR